MKYIKSIILTAILLTNAYAPIASMPGSNSETNAPQKFTPLHQFKGKKLTGNYFSSTQTATINDPSGQNSTSYTFNNVVPYSQTVTPPQGIAFGTFPNPNWVSSKALGAQNKMTTLYGVLTSQTNSGQ